jgi:ribosomal protein S27AE
MLKPMSATDRRPNDIPHYIRQTCENCGTELIYADWVSKSNKPEDNIWYDEFMCPICRDGVYMDWPMGK